MIDTLRPWIGIAFGAWLIYLGFRQAVHPDKFVGVGIIPATVPRTIRAFGILSLSLGIANVAINLPVIFS